MTIVELGEILSRMYENAPTGEKVTMTHLFSIRYEKTIRENNYIPGEILKNTQLSDGQQIPANYSSEINKGLNLAKYVLEKESLLEYINSH
jgi:hypothetical protein